VKFVVAYIYDTLYQVLAVVVVVECRQYPECVVHCRSTTRLEDRHLCWVGACCLGTAWACGVAMQRSAVPFLVSRPLDRLHVAC
jgi:hypothetical protein